MHGLRELRVVELSTGIAGAYCTKLLADAGADVIKVEPPEGDPLRRWSATGAELGGEDGALFRFLAASKRSLVGGPADAAVLELAAGADLVVESCAPGAGDGVLDWPARFPGLVLLSISPFGRGGPWRARAATEFTVQAESGSIGSRGLPGGEPFQAGGRITEWVAGTYAAVGALAAVQRARRSGHGEHVDFSLLEVMNVAGSNYMDLFWSLFGREPRGAAQTVETPSIEPTADGYVGFCTNSRQQFSDFLLLIDRPELRDDPALAQVAGRLARFAEWSAIVSGWTRRHTTAEVVERASLLRIPVAPVCNGDTVRRHEQLVARGVFQKDPSGSFLAPRPPWKLDGESPPPPRPAPRLGEHGGRVEPRPPRRPAAPVGERRLPLAGLRVLDATAWWAGPSATHMLACLGADVIHLESIQRPDGMRMMASAFGGRERWWEWSAFYLAANTNKRGLALNLADPRGVALAKRLIARCDAVVENFTPRVMDGFGLTWEAIRAASPRCIYVRMPAFGLDGPWRDHTGFAQTMEQITGLAWVTGHRDDQPRIQRGPCDPLAGMHAAFALLVALEERERTGRGAHVECTMVEGALNAAAEQLVEYTASGRLLQREGNRAPGAAPQGLYPCRGHDPAASPRWLALSVETDGQWSALVRVLGEPAWAREPAFASHRGRRAAHDALDTGLRRWAAERELDAAVAELLAAGVPAASVADPRTTQRNPQLAARGFYEQVAHPVVGAHALPTLPFRYASVPRWLRSPAPTLGQHGREILRELASASAEELEELAAAGVIGERPEGA